jgi:tRNA U34 5-methylaminomethyl-2-thiouridine-forming methyltransferase MnmC
MTPAIEIDRSQNLLVVVRFHRAASDQEFAQYVADYRQLLEQEPRFGAVFVTAPGLPMTPPRQVRMQAELMKSRAALMEQRVVGVAFALPSPLMRGVLRGVLMLQPMPCQHTVVGTEAEGVAWVKARLWTDHVRRMKGGA